MENNLNLEGKKTDNLEATSASDAALVDKEADGEEKLVPPTEEKVELNNSPVPTEEEIKDAGIVEDATISATEELDSSTPDTSSTETTPVESEQPVADENVEPVSDATITTTTPDANVEPIHEENGVTDTPAMKTFTQDELNDIVGKTRTETRNKTRDETFNYIYNRYGAKNLDELDEVVGNAQRYDSLREEYDGAKANWKEQNDANSHELAEVKEKVALMESGIDNSRFEDAKYILKGKGLDITPENIETELQSHPEWKKAEEINPNFTKVGNSNVNSQNAEPETKLSVLGNDNSNVKIDEDEDRAMKLFKV